MHTVHAHEVRATQVVFTQLQHAEPHAREISGDTDVLASAVTRYTLDELGQRSAVAMYVDGTKQQVPYVSESRTIWAHDLMR